MQDLHRKIRNNRAVASGSAHRVRTCALIGKHESRYGPNYRQRGILFEADESVLPQRTSREQTGMWRKEMSGRKPTFCLRTTCERSAAPVLTSLTTTRAMALQIETIRATADRVATSHGLDVVDLEFTGGGKHRSLRVFLEKDAAGRAKLAEEAAKEEAQLPKGVPIETLSGVTHDDCESFARDFGTVLDVEDLIPGAEYTLEVSSPGLERRLRGAADYERFRGSLVKVQTFAAVESNRHFTGRLTAFDGNNLTLDLSAVKQKGKGKKAVSAAQTAEISLSNIEKANLVAEI